MLNPAESNVTPSETLDATMWIPERFRTRLALVPSGSVSPGLYSAVNLVSGAFPFKPVLRALEGAISGGAILVPVVHLLGLTAAYTVLSRLALRRF